MITITIYIEPMGKPRMTRRDKWMKRTCVMRYRAWADSLRKSFQGVDLPSVHIVSWVGYFRMPESWSIKKKDAMRAKPHYSKPDRDNVDKAILDALFDNDSGISDGTLSKKWDDGAGPRLEISIQS